MILIIPIVQMQQLSKMTAATTISRVSCEKGPTRHAYAWQIGPFWRDTLDIWTLVPEAGISGRVK